MAENIILKAIDIGEGKRVFIALKLTIKAPDDTLEKFIMIKANEIALDIESDGEGRFGIILGGLADMMGEALLTEEDAFAFAARIRILRKATIPPIGADIMEKMVDDAITKRCGDDFAGDWVVDDKGDTTAGLITAADNTVTEEKNIFYIVNFETMLIDGFAFAFASDFVSTPKFTKQKFGKARILGHD